MILFHELAHAYQNQVEHLQMMHDDRELERQEDRMAENVYRKYSTFEENIQNTVLDFIFDRREHEV